MTYHPFVAVCMRICNEQANPVASIPMKAYMKHRFEFYGIKSPARKAIFRQVLQEIPAMKVQEIPMVLNQCWQIDYREMQYIGMLLLGKFIKKLTIKDLFWIEKLVLNKSWWDTVDFLAANVIGTILRNDPTVLRTSVERYRTHRNMWINRVALLVQLKYRGETDEVLLFETIDSFAGSKEFFINKAAGWALRQLSKYKKQVVRDYIDNRSLHPLIVREGSKYLK